MTSPVWKVRVVGRSDGWTLTDHDEAMAKVADLATAWGAADIEYPSGVTIRLTAEEVSPPRADRAASEATA